MLITSIAHFKTLGSELWKTDLLYIFQCGNQNVHYQLKVFPPALLSEAPEVRIKCGSKRHSEIKGPHVSPPIFGTVDPEPKETCCTGKMPGFCRVPGLTSTSSVIHYLAWYCFLVHSQAKSVPPDLSEDPNPENECHSLSSSDCTR